MIKVKYIPCDKLFFSHSVYVCVCPRTHVRVCVCVFQINILSIFKSATDGLVSSFDYPLHT